MSDCIWTYSDYRRVYTVELKNRINGEKKKVKFKAVLKYWLLKK